MFSGQVEADRNPCWSATVTSLQLVHPAFKRRQHVVLHAAYRCEESTRGYAPRTLRGTAPKGLWQALVKWTALIRKEPRHFSY